MTLQIIKLILYLPLTILPFLVISQSMPSWDEAILLSIKKQWSNQTQLQHIWNSTRLRPCNRYGIHCTGDYTVISISLHFLYITGEIPSSICNLKNLTHLNLGTNSFTGQFPTVLHNCTNLRYMDLSYNALIGTLPNDIGHLFPRLQRLDLRANHFCGGIPTSIADLDSLEYLDLSDNNLDGKIPPNIGNLRNLETLILSFNQFSGSIPVQISGLLNLVQLDLSHNNLSGQVPAELGRLRFGSINFAFNNLSGEIPVTIGNLGGFYFANNSNLCSDSPIWYLSRCSLSQHTCLRNFSFRCVLIIILLPCTSVLILVVILYIALRKKKRETLQSDWKMTAFQNVDFSEAEILSSLTEDNVIGSGGSGKIYRVTVNDNTGGKVAVKRMRDNRKSNHALEKQMNAEAEILGKIRHINIVKLMCVVSKADSRLLVYEYMENQSLDKWLHRKQTTLLTSGSILDWPTRLRVAIGAAKGLCYMHNDCSPPIIHRDVKSSNILLDSEFNAKIADFGLAKMTVHKIGEPHTASAVAGTFGYIAPEYWRTRRLSEKIDVYSFGVVLLELATGKEPCEGNDHMNLAQWSWHHYIEGHPMEDALDGAIKEGCYLQEMVNMFKVGLMCTSIVPSSRPSMRYVLQLLTECSSHYSETSESGTHNRNVLEPNIFIDDESVLLQEM